jgi:transcriptional regulator with XRE-family HTH domain
MQSRICNSHTIFREEKEIPENRPQCQLDENIRHFLRLHRISFRSLSQKSKIPVSTLFSWAYGSSPRNWAQLRNLARIIGISIESLCFEKYEPTLTVRSIVEGELS